MTAFARVVGGRRVPVDPARVDLPAKGKKGEPGYVPPRVIFGLASAIPDEGVYEVEESHLPTGRIKTGETVEIVGGKAVVTPAHRPLTPQEAIPSGDAIEAILKEFERQQGLGATLHDDLVSVLRNRQKAMQ